MEASGAEHARLRFTAQPIDASRAAEVGINNRVVAADEIDTCVTDIARRMSGNAPMCVAVMKEQIRLLKCAHALTPEMFERLQGLRRIVYDSQDYREGIQAFLDERTPCFTGE